MFGRVFVIFFAHTLYIQCALSQYIRSPALGGPYYEGYGPCSCIASAGGGFPVTSVSPIAPTGLTIVSEAVFEGPLAVGGVAPFLGAVALEGLVPTAGVGAVSYGCGSGVVGITSEGPYAGIAPGYNPGLAGLAGYGPSLAGPMCTPGLAYGTGCSCLM